MNGLAGLILFAAICWAFSAVGWVRVFTAKGDAEMRMDAVQQAAFVMVFACAVTAAALLARVW